MQLALPNGFILFHLDNTAQPRYFISDLITGEQWSIVQSLPLVNEELEDNPFDVAVINWFQAVEFAARVSRLSGKDIHIPSLYQLERSRQTGIIRAPLIKDMFRNTDGHCLNEILWEWTSTPSRFREGCATFGQNQSGYLAKTESGAVSMRPNDSNAFRVVLAL